MGDSEKIELRVVKEMDTVYVNSLKTKKRKVLGRCVHTFSRQRHIFPDNTSGYGNDYRSFYMLTGQRGNGVTFHTKALR